MTTSMPATSIQVETASFPPMVKPPASQKIHFLGGAGVRGLDIEGKFTKFTAIGVYLENDAVKSLSAKWKGKSADELLDSEEFFGDIVTGEFEKFMRVTLILPLTGKQFSEKLPYRGLAKWKSLGIYTEAEGKAIEKFKETFMNETFPPGSSILFTQFPNGTLAISFSKDESVPEVERAMIENNLLSQVVLESMIGKDGVTPAAKKSLANRLSKLLKKAAKMEASAFPRNRLAMKHKILPSPNRTSSSLIQRSIFVNRPLILFTSLL